MREWLKVMLEEIRRKNAERVQGVEEHRRREAPESGPPDAPGSPGRSGPGEHSAGQGEDGDGGT